LPTGTGLGSGAAINIHSLKRVFFGRSCWAGGGSRDEFIEQENRWFVISAVSVLSVLLAIIINKGQRKLEDEVSTFRILSKVEYS
jgi:hypothetical protein